MTLLTKVLSSLVPFALLGTDFGDIRNLTIAHTKAHFPRQVFTSLDQWTAKRDKLRFQILAAAGLYPEPRRTSLNPVRETVVTRAQYTVERVALQTMPGYRLAGNLYLPVGPATRRPAVLIPQGHWKHGRVEHREDYSTPSLGINLASQGFVAFSYDMVGYNELDDIPHDFGKSEEERQWSFNPLGVQLWNSIRAVDFLESLDQVDSARIAVTGASGGGTQTMLLAAVDGRIAASAPVVMVSAEFQGDDHCEMAPGLRVAANNVEIAAMLAPKPQLLVSSTKDWTKHTPANEYPTVRAIYELHRQGANVKLAHIDAPHNYNRRSREAVYTFLREHLMGTHRAVSESEVVDFPPESLLHAGPPESSLDMVFTKWREMAKIQMEALNPADARESLMRVIGANWPKRVDTIDSGEWVLLERDSSGERLPVRWRPAPGNARTLVVSDKGTQASWNTGAAGSVLFADVFQVGAAATKRGMPRGDYLTFHRSDDANRIQDVLTALAFLSKGSAQPVGLVCQGRANAWCALAAAVAPICVRFDAGEALNIKSIDVPGFKRAGGMDTVRRLLAYNSNLPL